MIRCNDPAKLNELLNHPKIRPNMGGEGWLDGTPLMGVFYLSEEGGMLFHGEDGLWEGHLLFHARAPYATALGMIEAFVLEFAPKMLWGRVPLVNRPARMFTRRLGFTSLGTEKCMPTRPDQSFEIFVWERGPSL